MMSTVCPSSSQHCRLSIQTNKSIQNVITESHYKLIISNCSTSPSTKKCHSYIHTYIYMYKQTNIHTHIHMYMHTHTYTHTYTHTSAHTHAHTHTHTQAFEVIIEAHTYQGVCITIQFMNHYAIWHLLKLIAYVCV